MNCPNCGTSNLDNATLCINCGRPLAAGSSYTPPPPPPPPSPSPSGGGYSYTPPPSSTAGGPQIPNYLWQAIVVTLCCCLPFGIVALVYSIGVNNKLAAGDIAGAQQASRNAKLWVIVALVSGLIAIALWFVVGGAAFLEAVRQGNYS